MTQATVERRFYPLLPEVFSEEPIAESEFQRMGFEISTSKGHERFELLRKGNKVGDLFCSREALDDHLNLHSLTPASWSAAMFLGWTFVQV
jgi:hypothetical protein